MIKSDVYYIIADEVNMACNEAAFAQASDQVRSSFHKPGNATAWVEVYIPSHNAVAKEVCEIFR